MPSLQLHQLRVAAVGKMVCENFTKPVNTNDVILACLFHDMGNIIKSELTYFPGFCDPEGVEYWEKVKSEFVTKYGTNHHEANSAIAREIGVPASAAILIDNIGFSQIAKVVADSSYERKIVQYSDARVGPHGILSVEERFEEGRRRYLSRKSVEKGEGTGVRKPEAEYRVLVRITKELEQQIFTRATITPTDISDVAIRDDVNDLRNYPVA